MDDRGYLQDVISQLGNDKTNAEKAMVQVSDEQFFAALDPGSNSIAVIVQHLGGNMLSRWKDFLTTDGEKPERDRDAEFELQRRDRAAVMDLWHRGWKCLFDTFHSLTPADLDKTVTIRSKPLTVYSAINRQLLHIASHLGQIVFLAKHFAGPNWKTLSIPKGQSAQFNREMFGEQKK